MTNVCDYGQLKKKDKRSYKNVLTALNKLRKQGPVQYEYAGSVCRDFHYKDKTTARPSYLYTWNPHTAKYR